MAESLLDQDEKVLEELRSQDISGFTPRGKLAIKELGDRNEGAMIFLILILNSRIRDLEKAMSNEHNTENHH